MAAALVIALSVSIAVARWRAQREEALRVYLLKRQEAGEKRPPTADGPRVHILKRALTRNQIQVPPELLDEDSMDFRKEAQSPQTKTEREVQTPPKTVREEDSLDS